MDGPTPDDPCPRCGERFERDPRELPDALAGRYAPAGSTSAQDAWCARRQLFIAEHGVLYRCVGCGYQIRDTPALAVPPPPPEDTAPDERIAELERENERLRAALSAVDAE